MFQNDGQETSNVVQGVQPAAGAAAGPVGVISEIGKAAMNATNKKHGAQTGSAASRILNNMTAVEEQREFNESAAETSYNWSKKSADDAYARQIDAWLNYNSPQAMVKAYEEAGLNPALMYGKGGGGGSNMPSVSSGQAISGNSSMTAAARQQASINAQQLNLQQQLAISQVAKTLAETANIKADTANKELPMVATQIEKLKVDMQSITEQTENYKVQREGYKLDNLMKEIETWIANEGKELRVDELRAEVNQINASIKKITAETDGLAIENARKDEMIQAQIDVAKAQKINLVAQAYKAKTGAELDQENMKYVQAYADAAGKQALAAETGSLAAKKQAENGAKQARAALMNASSMGRFAGAAERQAAVAERNATVNETKAYMEVSGQLIEIVDAIIPF